MCRALETTEFEHTSVVSTRSWKEKKKNKGWKSLQVIVGELSSLTKVTNE